MDSCKIVLRENHHDRAPREVAGSETATKLHVKGAGRFFRVAVAIAMFSVFVRKPADAEHFCFAKRTVIEVNHGQSEVGGMRHLLIRALSRMEKVSAGS